MRIFEEWTLSKYKRSTANEISNCLNLFDYKYKYKGNKISTFNEYDLRKNDFIVSASQMKSLVQLFPFIFCDIVDIEAEEYKYILNFFVIKITGW